MAAKEGDAKGMTAACWLRSCDVFVRNLRHTHLYRTSRYEPQKLFRKMEFWKRKEKKWKWKSSLTGGNVQYVTNEGLFKAGP